MSGSGSSGSSEPLVYVRDSEECGFSILAQVAVSITNKEGLNATVVTVSEKEEETFLRSKPTASLPLLHHNGMYFKGPITICRYLLGLAKKESLLQLLNGQDANEEGQIFQWLSYCVSDMGTHFHKKADRFSTLRFVEAHLAKKVFLVGRDLTLADYFLFSVLYHTMLGMNEKERSSFCNVARWFDHVQFFVSAVSVLKSVHLDLDCPFVFKPFEEAPKGGDKDKKKEKSKKGEEKEKEKEKKKEKEKGKGKEKEEEKEEKGERREEGRKKPEEGVEGKKEKKKKKNEKKKSVAPKKPAEIGIDAMDIRVGKIVDVKLHPDAESLYVEQIDVGEEAPRTIVSGLVKFIPIEEMRGRHLLVICNLKPSKLRGIESFGMVLAASNDDHTDVKLVDVPEGVPVGEHLTFEGYTGEPEKELNRKKTDKILPHLRTNEEGVALFKEVPFMTSKGVCKAPLKNAHIS
eukprot:TRINITY_DN1162_c2_g1_i1.p1 TRINITY_DN1162_c2_g1~~TRINITY_DN1162_c2_g1_i1.p1  ORF type:complete len:461 (-),score=171.33 TRINITY_DN1162_c2_g1_i1:115-1497(-)